MHQQAARIAGPVRRRTARGNRVPACRHGAAHLKLGARAPPRRRGCNFARPQVAWLTDVAHARIALGEAAADRPSVPWSEALSHGSVRNRPSFAQGCSTIASEQVPPVVDRQPDRHAGEATHYHSRHSFRLEANPGLRPPECPSPPPSPRPSFSVPTIASLHLCGRKITIPSCAQIAEGQGGGGHSGGATLIRTGT